MWESVTAGGIAYNASEILGGICHLGCLVKFVGGWAQTVGSEKPQLEAVVNGNCDDRWLLWLNLDQLPHISSHMEVPPFCFVLLASLSLLHLSTGAPKLNLEVLEPWTSIRNCVVLSLVNWRHLGVAVHVLTCQLSRKSIKFVKFFMFGCRGFRANYSTWPGVLDAAMRPSYVQWR